MDKLDNFNRRFLISSLGATLITACGGQKAYAKSKPDFIINGNGINNIVFIHGLGSDIYSSFDIIINSINQQYPNKFKSIAFNRKGYGGVKYDNSPRIGKIIAQEIYDKLNEANITPPFVVVGHSLGGVFAQYFARLYADKTKALLLIDPALDGQIEFLEDNYPQSATMLNIMMRFSKKAIKEEFLQSRNIYKDLQTHAPFGGKTIMLLANRIDGLDFPNNYLDFRKKIMMQMAQNLGAEFKIIGSGHFIQNEKPQIIIDAINQLIS
jgi:pimeloyl-ACP methyl ester carboxylesterase